jgi:hypothetical protein
MGVIFRKDKTNTFQIADQLILKLQKYKQHFKFWKDNGIDSDSLIKLIRFCVIPALNYGAFIDDPEYDIAD